MAEIKYLMDTNAAIDFIGGLLPQKSIEWLDGKIENEVGISVINKIELLGFNFPNKKDVIPFEELCTELYVFSLSDEIVNETISLRKKHKIKLPDAIIAATALSNKLTLLTRDNKGFKNIEGLTVLDLYTFSLKD